MDIHKKTITGTAVQKAEKYNSARPFPTSKKGNHSSRLLPIQTRSARIIKQHSLRWLEFHSNLQYMRLPRAPQLQFSPELLDMERMPQLRGKYSMSFPL